MRDEAAYFGQRAAVSRRASAAAEDCTARIAHLQLARQYQRLSDRYAVRPDSLASAIAIWTNEGGHV